MKFKYYYFFYFFFVLKYFSLKKFFNLLLVLRDFVFKKEVVGGMPFIASIDPANFCVLRCPLCPTGRGDKGIKKKALKFEDFKKYFDEMKDYLFFVRLYNWGEPFLAKDIFKMIEYAHQHRVGVVVNSNLNVAPDGLAEKIVKSRLDYLLVSIDGINQKTYGKYRKGGDLKKVFKVIKEIIDYKKKHKTRLPILHWGYLVHKLNYQDIEKAKKLAKKRGFDLITFPMLSMITKINDKFLKSNKDKWLGDELCSQRGESPPRLPCYFLWTSVNVSPSGDVFPCCGIYEDKYNFGNLKKNSLAEIWNNEKFRSARRLFGKDVKRKGVSTICHECDWFRKSGVGD